MDKAIYIPTPVAVPMLFIKWPAILLVASCIWGEARGEPFLGKVAVGWVIQNRVNGAKWYGSNHQEVILKPKQFSVFNAGDPNREKMKNPLLWDSFGRWGECFEAARLVLSNDVEDNTGGATHYHRADITPYWAKSMEFSCQIGNHKFYREK